MDLLLAVLQAITTLAVVATFVVYAGQLKAMREQLDAVRDSSAAQNLIAVIDLLQEPEVREARRVVLVDLRLKPLDEWTAEDKRQAAIVYSSYDMAGMLIETDIVPGGIVLENWGPSITGCHSVLEPYLKQLSAELPGAKYGQHLRWLRDHVQLRLATGDA